MKIYCDGGAIVEKRVGACAFVAKRRGKTVAKSARFLTDATNNIAEYLGLLDAIEFALHFFPDENISFLLDSELVVQQVKGKYKVKSAHLGPLHDRVIASLKKKWKISHIPRSLNCEADAMVKSILKEYH